MSDRTGASARNPALKSEAGCRTPDASNYDNPMARSHWNCDGIVTPPNKPHAAKNRKSTNDLKQP